MKLSTRDLTLISMFAALTAVGAQLSLPTQPVPFTLQILFCMYSGVLLGAKKAALSQILYVSLGLIGLPIFSGFKGGIQTILSPTFGYLLGFIVCAYVVGKITEQFKDINLFKLSLATVSGLLVVYLMGVPYLYLILNNVVNSPITFPQAITTGFSVFIIQDLIKCAIVSVSSLAIVPALKKAGYLNLHAKDVK